MVFENLNCVENVGTDHDEMGRLLFRRENAATLPRCHGTVRLGVLASGPAAQYCLSVCQ